VLVLWGFEWVEGEVVAAYETGLGGRVTVEVPTEGTDERQTVTFPLNAVEPAPAA
jgi:hypothetical protein